MKGCRILIFALFGYVLVLATGVAEVRAEDRKFEAQLIWGTDMEKRDDPKLKPVDRELVERLKKALKPWKYYYQVTNVTFVVPAKGLKRVTLSEKCDIEVRDKNKPMTEVVLFGEKKEVRKITQAVPPWLVIGGEDPNLTTWYVVLNSR